MYRYLKSVRPLLSEEEYKTTEAVSEVTFSDHWSWQPCMCVFVSVLIYVYVLT